MQKFFSALNHMHAQGIAHRDIKPENIMIADYGEVKLIDFGLSKRTEPNKNMKSMAGTPNYVAPEVLNGDYNAKCDTWSLGVILYMLMCGYLPFDEENDKELFASIKKGRFYFNHVEFKKCSKEVIDLITKLLEVDVNKRLSAAEALKHPWFQKTLAKTI